MIGIENCWYKNVCGQDNCTNSCVRFLEMQYLIDNSGIPVANQYPIQLVPDDIDYNVFCELADIKDNIVDFVQGKGKLYICSSNTGNGKTTWATKMMLRYFDEIWAGNGFRVRGLFLHVPTLLLKLKDFDNPLSEEYKQNILSCDLVIWDDIASTGISNYDLSQLLMYIDSRNVNALSDIFTGNIVDENQLSKIIGVRLASRIWNSSEVMILKGKDRRCA